LTEADRIGAFLGTVRHRRAFIARRPARSYFLP